MNKKTLLASSLLMLYAPFTLAEIQFNGFASMRASQLSSDGGDTPYSAFTEGQVSFKSESLFALQARADLGDNLSATLQLYSEGKSDFDLTARWAYITYQLNDVHQISVGKFAMPLFHQSEYEKVGYSHNYARLPKSVYSDFAFDTVEGISLDSTYDLDDYTLTTKLMYGNWDGKILGASFGFEDIVSAKFTLAGDGWQIFGGALTASIDSQQFDQFAIFSQVQDAVVFAAANGATESDQAIFYDDIKWDGKRGIYLFGGYAIDYNNWLSDFEYTDFGAKDSSDAFDTTWFISFGRRFGEYTVMIHHEEQRQSTDFGNFDDIQHPVLKATAQGVQTALGADQVYGEGITLRYDFHSNAALKFDYFNGRSTLPEVSDFSIVSAGVDIVF